MTFSKLFASRGVVLQPVLLRIGLFLTCITATGQVVPQPSSAAFQVEIRDFTPKFLAFYAAAKGPGISESERWTRFEKLDGFLAVPPTARGREEG